MTFAHLVRSVRGLLGDGAKPISQQRLSDLLGVSWSTVARWEGGQAPDANVRVRLERVLLVIELLGEMVRPEHRLPFLEQRNPQLLRLRPIDLLATDEGFEAVSELLEGVASGAFG